MGLRCEEKNRVNIKSRRSRPATAKPSGFGSGARTSYIGREHDKETDLGFGACPEALRGSVRLYEPEYGRFLSTDVLWGLYRSVQPYQYSLNQPVSQIDDGGKWVEAKTPQAQEAVRNSVPERFRSAVVFNDDGILQVDPLKQAAEGQDVNSNVAVLSRLAENKSTIEVEVADEFEYNTISERGKTASFETLDAVRKDGLTTNALTLLPSSDRGALNAKGEGVPLSASGNIRVVIRANDPSGISSGRSAAHELFSHVRFTLLWRIGKAVTSSHSSYPLDPKKQNDVDRAGERADKEAQK